MGFAKPIEQYLFGNQIHVFMYLKDIIRGDIDMSEKQKKTWLWLAGYEESTIDNILDVIKQKRR